MYRYLLIIGFLTGLGFSAMAQTPSLPLPKSKADSLQEKKDLEYSKPFVPKATTERVYHPDSTHSPHTAVMRSLFVPGLGQLYNRAWWKVPVIYTGLGLLGWMYKFNRDYYNDFLRLAKYRRDGDAPKEGDHLYALFNNLKTYPDQAVSDQVRSYARYRDLAVILFVASWGIQAIDAYIDAKFMHSYSMDTNFNVKVVPTIINQNVYAQNLNGSIIPGLKITFTLR